MCVCARASVCVCVCVCVWERERERERERQRDRERQRETETETERERNRKRSLEQSGKPSQQSLGHQLRSKLPAVLFAAPRHPFSQNPSLSQGWSSGKITLHSFKLVTFLISLLSGYQLQRGDNLVLLFDIRHHLYSEVTDIFWSSKQFPDF